MNTDSNCKTVKKKKKTVLPQTDVVSVFKIKQEVNNAQADQGSKQATTALTDLGSV